MLILSTNSSWKFYCAFQKHAYSEIQKLPLPFYFLLLSIIVTSPRSEPWISETHKMGRHPPITNHIPQPFVPIEVNFCSLRWVTVVKNTNVSCLLNFRISVFEKRRNLKRKILLPCSLDIPHISINDAHILASISGKWKSLYS